LVEAPVSQPEEVVCVSPDARPAEEFAAAERALARARAGCSAEACAFADARLAEEFAA